VAPPGFFLVGFEPGTFRLQDLEFSPLRQKLLFLPLEKRRAASVQKYTRGIPEGFLGFSHPQKPLSIPGAGCTIRTRDLLIKNQNSYTYSKISQDVFSYDLQGIPRNMTYL